MQIISKIFLSVATGILLAASLNPIEARTGKERKVILARAPEAGLQPQVVVEANGTVHLIYFAGEPMGGDVFYVRRSPQATNWSPPMRVNSQPGSIIAVGTVRGAHMAVGQGGRVHVAWMGAKTAEPRGPNGVAPMLYTRLNDAKTAFEPQRNLMHFADGLDGGASIAADERGNVYVAWHGHGEDHSEGKRRVWLARSTDEGKTFAREAAASTEPTGACACCGLRAFANNGALYILYRTATDKIQRNIQLLASKNNGQSFQSTRVHDWEIEACPMSTASFAAGSPGVLLAWETKGQVYYAGLASPNGVLSAPIAAPDEGGQRKHPVLARNQRGETILVWTEGTGWKRGGALAWQVFDQAGRPTQEQGRVDGIPVWSLAAVYARPDGAFTIIY